MRAAAVLALALASQAPGDAGPSIVPGITWDAAAGFDGRYVIGRWLPVRVTVANNGPDLDAEVAAAWGLAEYRQTLHLPSPSRKQIEFYVRASDSLDQLTIRLLTRDGRELDRRAVTLRAVPSNELLRLVVAESPESADGAVRVPAAALPLSWRGYDGAGAVTGDSSIPLRAEQSAAIARWRAGLADDGDVNVLRQETAAAAIADRPDTARWIFLAEFVAALALASLVLTARTRRVPLLIGAPVIVVVAFAAWLLAGAQPAIPPAHTRTLLSPTTDGGYRFTTVAMVTALARRPLLIRAASADVEMFPAIERRHVLRYSEDGRATIEIAAAAGERLSVAARGFAPELPCSALPCQSTADRVGLDLPVTAAVAWAPTREGSS